MKLIDELSCHAQAFETGQENGVTAESTAKVLRTAARIIELQERKIRKLKEEQYNKKK